MKGLGVSKFEKKPSLEYSGTSRSQIKILRNNHSQNICDYHSTNFRYVHDIS